MTITPKIQTIKYSDPAFGDSEIVIIDDCFTFNEIGLIYSMCFGNEYTIANKCYDDVQHLCHKRLISRLSDDDISHSGLFESPRREIFNNYFSVDDTKIQFAYINLGIKSDEYKVHLDCMTRNLKVRPITFLYYANQEWDVNWGGQTLIFDSQGKEIVHSISFKPGRVVIFDSKIPHTGTNCTPQGPAYRFTIAIKLLEDIK